MILEFIKNHPQLNITKSKRVGDGTNQPNNSNNSTNNSNNLQNNVLEQNEQQKKENFQLNKILNSEEVVDKEKINFLKLHETFVDSLYLSDTSHPFENLYFYQRINTFDEILLNFDYCIIVPEILSFIGFLLFVLVAGYFSYKYNKEIKKNLFDIVKYKLIIEKLFFFLRIMFFFLFISLLNPVIWSRFVLFSDMTVMFMCLSNSIKIFYVILFYYILKYLRYQINKYYIISIETFILLSCIFMCNFILFNSNNLIFTFIFFEILFFCFLPLLNQSYILCNTKIIFNSTYLRKNLENYRNIDLIKKELIYLTKFFYYTKEFFPKTSNKVDKKYTYLDLMSLYSQQKNILRKYNYSLSSTITYFLYNVFFAAFYLFGCILFLFYSSSLSYSSILTMFLDNGSLLIFHLAAIFILSLFCFKMGIFPFHGWILTVFSNTNFFVLMLLTLPFKLIVFYTFFRLFCLFSIFDDNLLLSKFFIGLGLLSIIYGAFGLFYQLNVRKFLAYSTIQHSGYILISLSINTLNGFFAAIVYISLYILTTLGFFYFIAGFRQKLTGRAIVNFSELVGGINQQKYLYFLFSILLLSLAGMPPLGGFWAKFFILRAVVDFSFFGLIILVIIILTTGISFIGYLRIIKIFFYNQLNVNKKKFEVFSEHLIGPLFFICFLLIISNFFILIPEYTLLKLVFYSLRLF